MKSKKVLTALSVGVLTASVVIGMTACGSEASKLGKTKLNLSDYIAEENVVANWESKTPAITQLTSCNTDEMSNTSQLTNLGILVLNKGTQEKPSYTLYSLTENKNIITGLEEIPVVDSSGSIKCLRVAVSTNEGTKVTFYTLDGKLITSHINDTEYYHYITMNEKKLYVNNETETSTVILLTVTKSEAGEYKEISKEVKYFRAVTDRKTEKVSYEVLTATNISSYGPEYGTDKEYNGLRRDIVSSTEDKPITDKIADYQVSRIVEGETQHGSQATYTYYKDGKETGSFSVTDGAILGYVGNYVYYSDYTRVPTTNESGFNYVEVQGYLELKYNYQLYRYDVVKGKTKSLNYNVVITDLEAQYNYTKQSYDAAVISGYEMVNGVAYRYANAFAYVVNKDLKVAFDLHGQKADVDDLLDLGNGIYYVDNTLLDSKLNIINTGNVCEEEGLIAFYAGGYYGFTDLNGKIVIEPKYHSYSSSFSFAGGAVRVYELQADFTTKEGLLKPDGSIVYLEDLEKQGDVTLKDGYYTITTKNSDGQATAIEYFTSGGVSMKKFTLSENVQVTSYTIGGVTYISETNTNNKTVTIYKLG